MNTVTVSPKFQVVIPKAIRDALKIRAGQKIQALVYQGRVELIPVGDVSELRGSLKGMDASDPREHTERP
jgi:AbrB family looped-hinge helix DNA binding protein